MMTCIRSAYSSSGTAATFRYLALLGVLALASTLASCDSQGKDSKQATATSEAINDKDPRWIHRAEPQKRVAVVFVHGIFGDTITTWTHPSGTTFFDLLKASPRVGEEVDVFAFGFTSRMFKDGSLSVSEAARSLHQYLQFNDVWEYDNVVFVTHSMGGLVTMRQLTAQRDLAHKVPLIVQFATPQGGSQITGIAQHVVNNEAIRQMLLVDHNEFLRELNNDWVEMRRAGQAPTVICAYETKPTKGVLIVPWSSSTRLCDEAAPAIQDADHLSIVKPDRATHPSVVVLVNALRNYVMPRLDANAWQTPNFEVDQDRWTFQLGDVNNFSVAKIENKSNLWLDYRIHRPGGLTLYIAPEGERRKVGPSSSDDLRMFPIGVLKQEYEFELQLGSTPPRKVRAFLPSIEVAQEQRAARMRGLAQAINNDMGSGDDLVAFQALPEDAKAERIAGVARRTLADDLSGLPEGTAWLVVADNLSQLNLSPAAAVAIRRLEEQSPETAQVPAVRSLATVISDQSGNGTIFRHSPTPDTTGVKLPFLPAETRLTTAQDQKLWTELAAKMTSDPDLKREGLLIQGDLLREQGNYEEAIRRYQEVRAGHESKVLDARLQALKKFDETQG
jgi:pimeloyl-ACP methyl ester carboxylesterase